MKFIDKLHTMADEAVEAIKWPFRRKAIERAADSVIDGSEEERLNVESKIVEYQRALTKASNEAEARETFKEIVGLRAELQEAEKLAEIAKKEKAVLFEADAKEEK